MFPPPKKPAPEEKMNPLSGKYDDFYANAKVYDQKFGLVLTADNLRNPGKMSLSYGPDNFYPWRPFAAPDRSQKKDKEKQQFLASQFAIHIDVQHFKPNEIRIKVTGRQCNVKASHADREDDHGFVARKFERQFTLPKDIDVESVKSVISSDGVLTFKAQRTEPKKPVELDSSTSVVTHLDDSEPENARETNENLVDSESSEDETGIEIPIHFVKDDADDAEKKEE